MTLSSVVLISPIELLWFFIKQPEITQFEAILVLLQLENLITNRECENTKALHFYLKK